MPSKWHFHNRRQRIKREVSISKAGCFKPRLFNYTQRYSYDLINSTNPGPEFQFGFSYIFMVSNTPKTKEIPLMINIIIPKIISFSPISADEKNSR